MTIQQLTNWTKRLKIGIWLTSALGVILLAFSIWALDYLDAETVDIFFHSGIYIFIVPRLLRSIVKIYTNFKISADIRNGKTDVAKTSVVFEYIKIIFGILILLIFTLLSFTEIDL